MQARTDEDETTTVPADEPPHPSIEEMERRLLGLIIYKPNLYDEVIGKLEPRHFNVELHGEIFEEVERQVKAGDKFSYLTLVHSMPNKPIRNNKDELHKYIIAMMRGAEFEFRDSALNFIPFIKRAYTIRVAAGYTGKLDRLSLQGKSDLVLAEFFEHVDDLRAELMDSTKPAPKTIGQAATDFVNDLNNRLQREVDDDRILSGLHTIDNHMHGFGSGELIMIAGRPGMGKTTLATCLLRRMAQKGHGGVMFSFEMAERPFMARMMSDMIRECGGQIAYNVLLAPNLAMTPERWDDNWGKVRDAQDIYNNLPIKLDCSSSMTIGELMASSRKMVRTFRKSGNVRPFIMIDYLKFIKASNRYAGNRVYEVGEITGSLKGLAKELDVPIFLLAQLNRIVEGRQDKRPTLSDLRDSGEIEQDADVVMFVYRPAYYEKHGTNDKDKLYLIIEKHRNGEPGELLLKIDMATSHVSDMEQFDGH